MFTWWKRRAALKQAREVVKNTHKLLRMHRDIIAPVDVAAVSVAADHLAGAVKAQNADVLESLTGKLDEKLGKAFPRQPWAALRENVEVFLVAAIVAMAPQFWAITRYSDKQCIDPGWSNIPTAHENELISGYMPLLTMLPMFSSRRICSSAQTFSAPCPK